MPSGYAAHVQPSELNSLPKLVTCLQCMHGMGMSVHLGSARSARWLSGRSSVIGLPLHQAHETLVVRVTGEVVQAVTGSDFVNPVIGSGESGIKLGQKEVTVVIDHDVVPIACDDVCAGTAVKEVNTWPAN